jgi:hypothetical protein
MNDKLRLEIIELIDERLKLRQDDIKTIKDKKKYGECIYLSEDEYRKLVDEFGVEVTYKMIENADFYAQQIGQTKFRNKYKSHYHTLMNWQRRNPIRMEKM